MALYYEGYDQAVVALQTMNEQELYEVLDTLYGRDQLPDDPDIEDLRREAGRQVREDFTDHSDPKHQEIEFWCKIMNAMVRDNNP